MHVLSAAHSIWAIDNTVCEAKVLASLHSPETLGKKSPRYLYSILNLQKSNDLHWHQISFTFLFWAKDKCVNYFYSRIRSYADLTGSFHCNSPWHWFCCFSGYKNSRELTFYHCKTECLNLKCGGITHIQMIGRYLNILLIWKNVVFSVSYVTHPLGKIAFSKIS